MSETLGGGVTAWGIVWGISSPCWLSVSSRIGSGILSFSREFSRFWAFMVQRRTAALKILRFGSGKTPANRGTQKKRRDIFLISLLTYLNPLKAGNFCRITDPASHEDHPGIPTLTLKVSGSDFLEQFYDNCIFVRQQRMCSAASCN